MDVVPLDDLRGEVASERAEAFIDDLADNDVYLLSFAGGEPLVREDLFALASYARSRGLTVVTGTNGVGVDDRAVARLRGAGFQSLQISLDGATAQAHEAMRGQGTFEPAVAAIEACRRGGLPVNMAVAVHAYNIYGLVATLEMAKRLCVACVKLQPVLRDGHHLSGPEGGLSPDEAMRASELVERHLEGSGVKLSMSLWVGIARDPNGPLECSNGLKVATVFHDGSVGVCEGEPGVGSAFDGRFMESWHLAKRTRRAAPRCACTPFIEAARRACSSSGT